MGSSSNRSEDLSPGLSLFRGASSFPSAAPGVIVDLRNLLAERFPQAAALPATRLSTGVATIDQAIGGGLPRGAITELTSPMISAGSALLIYALLQNAQQNRFFLALVDGRDSFDPQPLGDSRLRNLLWIRCSQAIEAIKAADLLLRDGNFPLVILDLVMNASDELRQIPQSNWYRLQRLVEGAPTAFLVLTRRSIVSSAQLKLSLDNCWRLEDLEQDGRHSERSATESRNPVAELVGCSTGSLDFARDDRRSSRLKMCITRAHGGLQQMAEAG